MKKLVISIVLLNLLVACASDKPKGTEAAIPDSSASQSESESASVSDSNVDADELDDPSSILAKRSVYYPFDVSAVQDEDKPVVQAHARYLSQHSDRNVRVEGNADERGSNEYNLALGQRRADGVKKMLVLGGAKSSQIETSSYGEEKPVESGHDEASWSKNRRADIEY